MINGDSHLLPRSSDFSLTTGCGGGDKDSRHLMNFPKAFFSYVQQVNSICLFRNNYKMRKSNKLLTFSPLGPLIPGNPGGPLLS